MYPCFDIVIGFAWSNVSESYAGGNVATNRAAHVGQVEGDDPDRKGCPSSLCWLLGVGLTTPFYKIYVLLRSI
jgi:hypothetical protein